MAPSPIPPIAAAVSSLGTRQAYLDGELCGVFPDGITSFSMIQAASDAGNAAGLVYLYKHLVRHSHAARNPVGEVERPPRRARVQSADRRTDPRVSGGLGARGRH